MEKELLKEGIFDVDDSLYGTKIRAIPKPKIDIGIDQDDTMLNDIIEGEKDSTLNVAELESFTQASRNRNELYNTLDVMANDSKVAAILETYAEDATERNEQGNIVWVESSDARIGKYITYLLNTMRVDKHIYKWIYNLCKYGDLYIRLYRESDVENPLFNSNGTLNEEVQLNVAKKSDHFIHYIEMVPNPATMFELTQFGKTVGYIQADPALLANITGSDNLSLMTQTFKYKFHSSKVKIFQPDSFVHATIEDTEDRFPEEVDIFMNDDDDEKSRNYIVRKGKSLLYNSYKIWRQLMLLENSILLNRLSKSSVVRVVQVEVGDMPKEKIRPHLMEFKQMIEQKASFEQSLAFSEYNNPGPIENTIYVPTRNGQGAVSAQNLGEDVDVKSLADLDHFVNTFYGSFRVPKAFFGETDDGAGFNGGESLSIISSRYAKTIKKIQNTMIQALTDAINLMLIDKKLNNYVNKFTLHMLPPVTQDDITRRDNMSSNINVVSDVLNLLGDIDTEDRLKVLKSMISPIISNTEVVDILSNSIEKIELEGNEDVENEESEEDLGSLFGENNSEPNFGGLNNDAIGDIDLGDETAEDSEQTEAPTAETNNLPSPEQLGKDFTDNNEF